MLSSLARGVSIVVAWKEVLYQDVCLFGLTDLVPVIGFSVDSILLILITYYLCEIRVTTD